MCAAVSSEQILASSDLFDTSAYSPPPSPARAQSPVEKPVLTNAVIVDKWRTFFDEPVPTLIGGC
jgi:hypothetical protein